MKFRIPFSSAHLDILKKRSAYFTRFFTPKKDSNLKMYLENAEVGLTREEYLAIGLRGMILSFITAFIISTTLLWFLSIGRFILLGFAVSVMLSAFIFILRVSYPKIYSSRKQKEIEKNLIPALGDILVQLNSGVPLFTILINISSADYGALSEEFKKVVRKINAGLPQIEVLEEVGEKNPSLFFRRALWQVSNGMRAGSDISIVIRSTIKSLNDEQLIQIQNYGNKLNPMIMFYMLSSVILPALAITFLTVISSLTNFSKQGTMAMFIFLFVFVVFLQLMFLGVIKSMRPSLL